MLARSQRIVSGDDYRRIVRKGRRSSTAAVVIYRVTDADGPSRFGFIVSKAVGNAVVRNRVRRRLKAIAASVVHDLPVGTEVVVRALPGCDDASWVTQNTEISEALTKGRTRV